MSDEPHLVARIAKRATYAQGLAALAMGATAYCFNHLAAGALIIFGAGNVAAKLGQRLDRSS